MPNLFENFLNQVNRAKRAYGQVDKSIFAGMLPGGADSPLISAPQNLLSPASIVRSSPFQAVRDVALEHSGLPKPEQFYIKAMTGGSKDITTMSPEELALVKGAYEAKRQHKPTSPEKMLALAKLQEELHNKFVTNLENQYNSSSPEMQNSPIGQKMFSLINTPFDLNKTFNEIQEANKASEIKRTGPVVSLYGQGRDMRMAYGNLSVFPQPGGGVQIYDRWKVDKAEQVMPGLSKFGMGDKADSVADLGEGGPIPSLIYNAAKTLGTYEPFDIRVNVPAQQWQSIQGKTKQPEFATPLNNQGPVLNWFNDFYLKLKGQGVTPSKGPMITTPFSAPLAP